MTLAGRVALVTGGGRGIGRAIGLALAENGADVAVNFRRDEGAAAETVAEIEKLDRRAAAYRASVEVYEEDQAMVDAIVRDFGHIDILINNAGIASRGHSVADGDPAELVRVVNVHAISCAYLSHLVLPTMRTRPRGDIIMISSMATEHMAGWSAPYNMGKAAQEALAMTLAKEEVSHGIRVNVVRPGLVETEMGRRLAKGAMGVDNLRKLDAHMPYGRICQPEDVAAVVLFLVSETGSYINGQRIGVDGGGPAARR